jgi:hypothetical protein
MFHCHSDYMHMFSWRKRILGCSGWHPCISASAIAIQDSHKRFVLDLTPWLEILIAEQITAGYHCPGIRLETTNHWGMDLPLAYVWRNACHHASFMSQRFVAGWPSLVISFFLHDSHICFDWFCSEHSEMSFVECENKLQIFNTQHHWQLINNTINILQRGEHSAIPCADGW